MTRALALALAPLACVAVVVLGPTKRFERSALGRAHRALGDAAPRVATALVTIAVCDRKRGAAVASACFDALDRPNPLGQIVYLTLAIGGHASFVEGVEKRLLDGGDARGWTAATSAAFACACATWALVCCSEPGTITRENNEEYLKAYAYDEIVYHRKRCRTTGKDAPARSKWCTTTERRVARFDHFCVWVNNTIGANNLRWFLLFLFAQLVLVGYVTLACAHAVRRSMTRRDCWSLMFQHETPSGARATLGNDKALLYRFVVYHYAPAVTLGVFCALVFVLLSVFLGYNAWLAAKNVTTNETFKWELVRESVETMKGERAGGSGDEQIDWGEMTTNKYDVGIWGNIKEVLFPPVKTPSAFALPWDALKAKRP